MKKLTTKEEEIMDFFWKKGPMFVRELLTFYDEPRPHFNTVSTIVRILENKGFLSHETFGNTYRYFAVTSEEEFHNETLKNIVSRYFNNSYFNIVSSFVEEEKISLDELKKLIETVQKS
jgi:predicted transcriptional regulator